MSTPLPSRFDDGQDWPPFRLTPPGRPRNRRLAVLSGGLAFATLVAGGVVLVERKRPDRRPADADRAVRDAARGAKETICAAGEQVFARHCRRCHYGNPAAVNPGPDLAAVGRARSADWIEEHARNPRAHDLGSAMPSFAGILTADEVRAVAAFLADRK